MRRVCACLTAAFIVSASTSMAQDRRIIMIDPGHGGDQAGVATDVVLEKDVALRAGFALGAELVRRGYDVRLTRTGDYAVSFPDRRVIAEEAGAALMISLHFNGDDDTSLYGIEIYGNLDDAAVTRFATSVAGALRESGSPVTVEGRPWDFLKSPTVPTLMIEAGFMTHPVERRMIMSAAYHHDLATRLADGIQAVMSPSP